MPKYLNDDGVSVLKDTLVDYIPNGAIVTDLLADGSVTPDKLADAVRKGYVRSFDTVAEMQAAIDLQAGMVCHTNGFHASGDGGAAYYTISASGTANGMDVLGLQGGLFATLVVTEPYVTPEQFGAYGDGTHDDTAAWQNAVNVGLAVKAASDQYLCGEIDVTKNLTIDCNGAAFTCTANRLFNCHGEVVTTLTGEADYTAHQVGYAITDANYSNYTGFAMLKGTNNFEPSRSYYLGGFACTFKSGKMVNSYPIDVTGVSIEIVNPITVEIVNIGDIKHTSPTTATRSIEILYGMGCNVRNLTETSGSSYMVLALNCCLSCVAEGLHVEHSFIYGGQGDSYVVALLNSSMCIVRDSHMHNVYHECISTGDQYLCYANVVSNCVLLSDVTSGFADHENGLGTRVINSVASGVAISGLGHIEDVTLVSMQNTTYKNCFIRICPCAVKAAASYVVRGVRFMPDKGGSGTYTGIWIASAPQVAGGTYYLMRLDIEDCYPAGTIEPSIRFSLPTTSTYNVEQLLIRDSWINIELTPPSSVVKTKYSIEIIDCKATHPTTSAYMIVGGGSSYVFQDVTATNCRLRYLRGSFVNVTLDNVLFSISPLGTSFVTISGKLYGTGIRSRLDNGLLLTPTDLMITDMVYSTTDKWLNIALASDDKRYYQHIANGSMQLVEITT